MDSLSTAPTTTEGALHLKQHANNTRVHLSPTQWRITKLLLDEPLISFDLERLACCRYAADSIQHLKAKGINIITTMVPYIRHVDGKTVMVGKYSIAPESRDLAIRSVRQEGIK